MTIRRIRLLLFCAGTVLGALVLLGKWFHSHSHHTEPARRYLVWRGTREKVFLAEGAEGHGSEAGAVAVARDGGGTGPARPGASGKLG